MDSKSCELQKIKCGHVWGGIKNADQDIETSGLRASLYSHAADGGKGGDIYYFSVCQGDVLTRVAIADVVGHGAEVSKISETVFNNMLENMNQPESEKLLGQWNNSIESQGMKAMTTAVIGGVVATNRRLHYSYAGHHPIFVKKRLSKTWQSLDIEQLKYDNLPLGIERDSQYDQWCDAVEEGDKFFLYTDGVLEAKDSNGEFYGEERLLEALNEASLADATDIKSGVLESLRTYTNDSLNHDDFTLIAIDF